MVAQLCKHYKLHHIKMADVIKETLDRFVSKHTWTHHTQRDNTHAFQFVNLWPQERLAARVDVTDEDEESDEKAQQAQEYLELLKEDRENEEHLGTYGDEVPFHGGAGGAGAGMCCVVRALTSVFMYVCIPMFGPGRYSDEHILKFFKDKLTSMPCQNQVSKESFLCLSLDIHQCTCGLSAGVHPRWLSQDV